MSRRKSLRKKRRNMRRKSKKSRDKVVPSLNLSGRNRNRRQKEGGDARGGRGGKEKELEGGAQKVTKSHKKSES